MVSFYTKNTNLLSSVLLFECGRAGLCGGKLRGPSILRDIIEFRLLLAVLSLSPATIVSSTPLELICTGRPPIDMVICPCTAIPGVLDVDRCIFGDDGTLPIVCLV